MGRGCSAYMNKYLNKIVRACELAVNTQLKASQVKSSQLLTYFFSEGT